MNISVKSEKEFYCSIEGRLKFFIKTIYFITITFILIYPAVNEAKIYSDTLIICRNKIHSSSSDNFVSVFTQRPLAVSNLLLNGKNNTKILCGDSVNIQFDFFPGRQTAELSLFVDLNNNEVLDEGDLQYGKSIVLKDGDFNDVDKKVNSHYKTVISKIPGEEIPVNCVLNKTIFFRINDGINKIIASLIVKPAAKSFPISGWIINPRNKANLAVIAWTKNKSDYNKYLAFTDMNGYFHIDVPDDQNNSCYSVQSVDRFNVLHDNYFEPKPAVVLGRNMNDKIMLQYAIKTSFLSGRIVDQDNNPVKNIRIYARDYENSESKPSFSSITDSSGFYRIGVSPGIYKISFDAETLFPNYMYPEEPEPVSVLEGQVKDNIMFTALKSDGYIKGEITINGEAAKGIYVAAWNDKGSFWQKTGSSGKFILKVNKAFNYHVDIDPAMIPSGCYEINSGYSSVKPDSGNIYFAFQKASVKLEGTVFDNNSNRTLENILISATDGKRTIFTKTDSNGHFDILGEGGKYYLMSSEEEQIYCQADTNLIANNGDYHINFILKKKIPEIESGENNFSNKLIFKKASNNQSGKETVIKYTLPKFSRVILKIYDSTGNEVATLEDKKKSAGVYEINLDASRFSSGIYMYKLQAGQFSETRKFIIAK